MGARRRQQTRRSIRRYDGAILASSVAQSKGSGGGGGGGGDNDGGAHAPPGSPPPPARHGGYLLGPLPDFVLVGPGLTVLVTGVLAVLAIAGRTDVVTSIAFALTLIFVGPHYAATYRRAFGSLAMVRAHPVVTVVVPFVLAGVAVAAVRWPRSVGFSFFAVYVVWSGYHYSGQSLGLAMVYPLRQGARLSLREKRLVAVPLYGSWLLSLLGLFRLNVAVRNPAYELTRQGLFRLPVPAWVLAVGVVGLIASLSAVAVVAYRRRRAGIAFPGAVWFVVLTQVAWFSVGLWHPFFNIVLVPIFHGAQYLAITSWHQARGRRATVFALYAVTVLVVGLAVNPGLMVVGRVFGGEGPIVAAAVLSFINLHHFLMDGRIWRLREKRLAESMAS